MSNKETLQSYNDKLIKNNDDLQTVINMINNLPEAGEGGNTGPIKQYASTLISGTLAPSSPPTYINSNNINRAQYMGFELLITPGRSYRFVGQSGYNYEPRQINDDVKNAMSNGEVFPEVWDLDNLTWSGSEFTFTAVEGAKYFWFNVKDANNPEATVDITKALPVYIESMAISEDLTEELTDYDTKLTVQEDQLLVIAETLKNKMLGASLPEKGVVITNWDEDGLPLKINVINIQKLKDYMFAGNGEASNVLANNIKSIVIDESTTEVGTNCFMNNQSLISVLLSGGAPLPAETGTQNGIFSNSPKLQAVWLGSNTTSIGIYTFYNNNAMRRIFIDLPRSTVAAMSYYSNGFSNNTFLPDTVVVCNDDANFKTKEEFEEIDWTTYINEQTDCSNLFTKGTKEWILNQIAYYRPTNCFKMFYNNSTNMRGDIDMTSMDVSQCTNFESMFEGLKFATKIDVSNWDTSNATNFQSMFIYCFQNSVTGPLDLSSFNTEKVTNMAYMFWYTTTLGVLDISSFDFSNVTNYTNMFNNCGVQTSTSLGGYGAGIPYVYVKDEAAQNWVLTAANAHPTSWSTANVIIKSEVTN